MLYLNDQNFKEVVNQNKVVIVDFYADWCNPCLALGPILEQVSKNYPNIVFAKVNVDECPVLCEEFKITGIPFVVKLVDGKVVDQFIGLHNEEFVERFFAN